MPVERLVPNDKMGILRNIQRLAQEYEKGNVSCALIAWCRISGGEVIYAFEGKEGSPAELNLLLDQAKGDILAPHLNGNVTEYGSD